MNSKLIVALDFDNLNDALSLVDKLDPTHCCLKVGSEMFTLFGTEFVKKLVFRKFNVFLDLKFHDIPNTVANACKASADLGVWMMNLHASGGFRMMEAAKKALEPYDKNSPILIAVTVLTSFSEGELARVGINLPIVDQVRILAKLAKDAGLDGVVSSSHEVKLIKETCGNNFIAVTPGIRLPGNKKDDQSRVMSPLQAIQEGSDYLVVGRPITQASDPSQVVAEILGSIRGS